MKARYIFDYFEELLELQPSGLHKLVFVALVFGKIVEVRYREKLRSVLWLLRWFFLEIDFSGKLDFLEWVIRGGMLPADARAHILRRVPWKRKEKAE